MASLQTWSFLIRRQISLCLKKWEKVVISGRLPSSDGRHRLGAPFRDKGEQVTAFGHSHSMRSEIHARRLLTGHFLPSGIDSETGWGAHWQRLHTNSTHGQRTTLARAFGLIWRLLVTPLLLPTPDVCRNRSYDQDARQTCRYLTNLGA